MKLNLDKRKPVVAALSGGVDSAVAAALLVRDGYRVVGITMRLFDARGTEVASGGRCCGPRDIEDARRVCEHLDIPHYVVDFQSDFQREVVDDFVAAYLRGETPNPCVRCNQHIKFTPLLGRARALGSDVVVTGHYARLEAGPGGAIELRRGVDPGKDQSYFLFSMPIGELAAVRFPLGGMRKEEVRQAAHDLGLPNAHKPESQEICFVPDGDYAGFVEQRASSVGARIPVAGDIVDLNEQVVGRHQGIHRYTVGQRRGLGEVKSGGQPVYVVRVDRDSNRVVVGAQDEAMRRRFSVAHVRWFADVGAGTSLTTTVQVRYRAEPMPARVEVGNELASVELLGDGVTASPGQSAVFYDDDRVLGGGWIRYES